MKNISIQLFSDPLNHEEDVIRTKENLDLFFEDYDDVSYTLHHYESGTDWKDKYWDFLIFDYGGMCLGNNMHIHFSRYLLKFMEDHPSRFVVITSAMTEFGMREAMEELDSDTHNVLFSWEDFLNVLDNEIMASLKKEKMSKEHGLKCKNIKEEASIDDIAAKSKNNHSNNYKRDSGTQMM